MRRYHLLPILMFLTGLAVGVLAAGGYGKPHEPAAPPEAQDVADGLDAPDEAESTSISTEKSPAIAALSAKIEELATGDGGHSENAPDLEARFEVMNAEWARLQDEMARLRERVNGLERRLAASAQTPGTVDLAAARPSRPTTPEDRRSALVAAGVAEDRAADLVWRQGQQELDRLDLRDIAVREGWFGSDRYRDELSRIEKSSVDTREEIGENLYDRYLFATGVDNRVSIDSIIPGSAAEDAGLQPGDLIETYGKTRVFRYDDLRTATSEGERGELVPVQIRRGDGVIDAWLPRGPLGIRMDRSRIDPDA